MAILLVYRSQESLVVCSDRAQDATARFIVLPNGLVVSAPGRADLCTRLFDGTAKLVTANPQLRFTELSGTFFPALRQAFDERPNPRPHECVVGLVCGWDRAASKMRVLSARKTKRQFSCSENMDPLPHAECFSAVGLNPQHILAPLSHAIGATPVLNRTPAFLCEAMRYALHELARLHPHAVSAGAYFVAFAKAGRVALPAEFAAPAVSGQSSDEKTRN